MNSKTLTLQKETLRSIRVHTRLAAGRVVQGDPSNPAPSSIIVQECVAPQNVGLDGTPQLP